MSCGFLADERARRARRRRRARHPPALRRGARAARHGRRAEVRRATARRALPDAQRRRAHRHRPDARRSRSTSATGARATLALVPVEDPSRLRARAPRTTTARCASSSRSPARTQIDTQPDQRRRLRARARRARAGPARARTSRSSARCSRGWSATACTASPASGYWLDIGTPERYLQGTFDILEGNVRHGGRASASAASCARVDDGAEVRRPRRSRRRCVERGCRDRRGRARRQPRRARRRTSRSARGTTIERAVVLEGARSARTACCATASSAPASPIGDGTHIEGGAVLGEGVTVGADNVITARRAYLPGRRAARRGDHSSEPSARRRPALDARRASAARRLDARQLDATPRAARAPARRAVAGRVGEPRADCDAPGGPGRRRHGRLGDRRRARPRARSATAPRARSSCARATGCRRGRRPTRRVLCASYSGNTEETLACYEAAGALGAQRDRRHDRRAARRAGPRRRRAGDPAARRLPAARGRRLHDRRRARGRGAVRRRPAPDAPRSTSPPRTLEQLVAEWGPDAPRTRWPRRSPAALHGTVPRDRRRRPDRAVAYRWKTPDQRERQAAAPSRTSCPSSTTTRSSAGRAPRELGPLHAPCSSTTPTCTRASRAADRADRAS